MSSNGSKTHALRVAIIGCGQHTCEDLLPPLMLNPRVLLTLAIEPSAEQRRFAAQKFSIPRLSDRFIPDEIASEADAAIVAGPPSLHEFAIRELIPRGVHLLVEKPPVVSLNSLRNLIQLCAPYPAKVYVGHNFRHSPAYSIFKNRIQLMEGQIALAEVAYHASLPVGKRWGLEQPYALLMSHFGHVQDILSEFFSWSNQETKSTWSVLPSGHSSAVLTSRFSTGEIVNFSISSLAPRFALSAKVTSDRGEVVQIESLRKVKWYGFKEQNKRDSSFWEPRTLESGLTLAGYAAEVDAFVNSTIGLGNTFPSLLEVLPGYEILDAFLSDVI